MTTATLSWPRALTRGVAFASNNPHKHQELADALVAAASPEAGIQLHAIPELTEVEEPGHTYLENALIKARHGCRFTELPVIAEDSGLEVEALQGAPGVYTARYAPDDAAKIGKLLAVMRHVPAAARTARYVCCLVLLRHAADATPLTVTAIWRGKIATEARGATGFGFDPIFEPAITIKGHVGETVAQWPLTLKNHFSHRSKAADMLMHLLEEFDYELP